MVEAVAEADRAGSVELRPYQVEAVEAITGALRGGGRAQVHAACGTGKTLIAARAAETLGVTGGLVVIVCPSLALVAQTIRVWAGLGLARRVLAVCSDETLPDAVTRVADLPCPVSTDPAQIAEWSRPDHGAGLVVGTHVSADRIGAGLRRASRAADLLVVDEAHHTAGVQGKHSHLIHRDNRLPARRRLYMTATPRLVTRTTETTERVVSMDDTSVFGPVVFSYPFSRAIAEGFLEDYRVAVVGVSRPDVLDVLRRVDPGAASGPLRASVGTAIAQAALANAACQFGLRHIVAFCPRITAAAEFARTLPRTLDLLGADRKPGGALWAGHVHGGMNAAQRGAGLDRLATPPAGGWSVLANARCLTEGIDLPAIDGILFAHPKGSVVDIVQAIGRAVRPNPAGTGIATIIMPLLLPDDPDELDDVVDAAEFSTVWKVLRALRATDDTLAAGLDSRRVAAAMSRAEPRLPERISVLLPDGYDDRTILDHLTVRILRGTTSLWWDGYAAAKAFHDEHGHLRVPQAFRDASGFPLGRWIRRQREMKRGELLTADQVSALDQINIVWNRSAAQWALALDDLRAYRDEYGHSRVPATYMAPNGFALGGWMFTQRQKHRRGVLSADRVADLEALGMEWAPQNDTWERWITTARAFHTRYGHLLIERADPSDDARSLGYWVGRQRQLRRHGELSADQIAQLDALNMVWDPIDALWQQGFNAARDFHANHGHLLVPDKHITTDGYALGTWITTQRGNRRKGRISDERVAQLNTLNMIWDAREAQWNHAFEELRAFHTQHGHLTVPIKYTAPTGFRLAYWLKTQRKRHRDGKLEPDRITKLNTIGDWT